MEGLEGAASQFGLISALRTGNAIVDMAICMLIPLLFGGIGTIMKESSPMLKWLLNKWQTRNQVTRVIAYEKRTNSWGYSFGTSSSQDNLLQSAILLYLSKHTPDEYDSATLSLTSAKKSTTHGTGWYDDEDDDDDDGAAPLKGLKVSTMPPEGHMVDVGEGVMVKKTKDEQDQGDEKGSSAVKTTTTYITLYAHGPRAQQRINAYVDRAVAWYKHELREKKDDKRYMYMMLHSSALGSSDEGGAPKPRLYKRYELSSEKTFDSLFFPEKQQLLYLLDHFQAKTGKFAVPGFPHKLGLLLHGPPGTGKTSLIKAIAHYTNRHIVNVPLSKIKTNQELMDVMFDRVFRTVNGGSSIEEASEASTPPPIDFKRLIFVMEDVDAASKVVKKRKGSQSVTTTTTKTVVRGHSSAGDRADGHLAPSRGSSALSRPPTLLVPSRNPTKTMEADDKSMVETVSNGDNEKHRDDEKHVLATAADEEDEIVEERVITVEGPSKDSKMPSFFKEDEDKLDLAGLLNILDGVVDSPNRIVVMTTNHPEQLDPALIRPGRINKKMLLGYLHLAQAEKMVEHYFGTLTNEQRSRLASMFTPNVFTPAQVEQLCAEYDTVDDFLIGLYTLKPGEY